MDNGVNGFLVHARDSAALAAALEELLLDADRREQFGCAARNTFESRFRLERMIERTMAIYDMVLSEDAAQ